MPGRVLILEHHRDLREALVEALLDEEYVVTPAPTIDDAVAALRTAGDSQLPDVVVIDACDGHALLQAIRDDPRCQGVAVVTLSFRFDPPSDADVDVRRPFRLDEFLRAVHQALVGRSPPPGPPVGANHHPA